MHIDVAYLPLSAVFRVGVAVAPPDYLNWRQESVQASRKHRLHTQKRLKRMGHAGRWIRSSASLVTSVRCASGSACQACHGALDCPFRAEMVSVRATVTYLACAALARYADAAQACVAGSQQQRLLDDVHAHHCCHGKGPLQAHRALADEAVALPSGGTVL